MSHAPWRVSSFDGLTTEWLYALLRLRAEVFVVEQACAFLDLDGRDTEPDTLHLMGFDQHGELVRYARLLGPREDSGASGEVAIGRVVCARAARGNGQGHGLIARAVEEMAERWPGRVIKLSAQAHLQGFYAAHGFVAQGETYLEDGIPHVDMRRPPSGGAPMS
ncbi:GNAT family N-acetyltransferase [Halotalea alkalilenta]|uniref:GNAT family N-acetyltransferase n=1 Tax=Halotalea alkalilenta TaxID=376489 RepID=UPI00069402AA|nr:GNAT family N-acetyltransferase [Halotalea alkalilenta]